MIDFEQFLELQRRLPAQYSDRRLANCIPMERFDDHEEEAEILHKVIRTRRLSRLDPLKVEFFRRDDVTNLKITAKGSVLDFDPETQRYLI